MCVFIESSSFVAAGFSTLFQQVAGFHRAVPSTALDKACMQFRILYHRFYFCQPFCCQALLRFYPGQTEIGTLHLRFTDVQSLRGDEDIATGRPRYTVCVDNGLFQQIEDFRFERRFQTRSEATVGLIRLGLEQISKERDTKKVRLLNRRQGGQSRLNGHYSPEICRTVSILLPNCS